MNVLSEPVVYKGVVVCVCRLVKVRVWRRWREYVPEVREEREREVRRAELRRKVSQWLPDYQPLNFDFNN